ncbi:4-(cytidine 5'-diphospho)-2-C-methyl-D-erythritol kinase [Vannielia sp.]|uniref:4-(cytidine 5'-diphospho)-2-C-methyl-D-erythritol kinase n=1 Tax=Vannielia sp. TaxID=2813045 RepID=UPI002606588F|nr:4-(cytidine 5'-diphospho)-2-C-methyl-D-erythritol kinase [Vannielia sp.]MDF1872210.1 4-(cytidine 5'-diphospho)-2-C-methyl-D-erythritol kinase [Vannielia sp.]
MTKVEGFAPAKINLALHVTGKREDGYHLLDSLVVFGGIGDRLIFRTAQGTSFGASGPFGGLVPVDGSNLVIKAAELMMAQARRANREVTGLSVQLEKYLPIAAGIGGGSSDAAATCRALSELWEVPIPDAEVLARELGADVPVCLDPSQPQIMRGIGEKLTQLDKWPTLNLLLVNPGFALATDQIFAALENKANPAMTEMPPGEPSRRDLLDWLAWQRNDLQDVTVRLAPEVGEVIDEITSMEGCMLARMSGSGATCFGIFEDHEMRDRAAGILRDENPTWWVAEA